MKKTTGERVKSSEGLGGEREMCETVKRKKKGRPSKADLARRVGSAAPEPERRRSLRRRNVRYNFDCDDYLDDDFEEEEEEEERRREKKVKLVVKLDQGREADAEQTPPSSSAARGRHAVEEEEEEDVGEDEEEEESERRKVKKRRISGSYEDDEVDDNDEDDGDVEGRGRKGDSKGLDSAPGTPWDPPSVLPMPSDKKRLELILDKLQKKDTYGVYAEPVDPEELPDYHEVIDNPMDFQTVRTKLGNGSYSTLDQFESDVFLICSNAMQYNAPDTIYHKQARTIQEMAKKKFQKLRIYIERTEKERLERPEKEIKSELKTKPNFLAKKPAKKHLHRTPQEPAASDFSYGASLPTTVDVHNSSIAVQSNGCERGGNSDLAMETTSMIDFNLERTEELSLGKGLLHKSGKRSFILDENRRATYSSSNQPVIRSESVFTTFEGEAKQLIAVGLHAEYFYARSLARFAATLGSVAWKIASQRIEQALPVGCKYGRGWVGEYEPLSAPILMHENLQPKEAGLFSKLRQTAVGKDDATNKISVSPKGHQHGGLVLEQKPFPLCPSGGPASEGKAFSLASSGDKARNSVNVSPQQQLAIPRKSTESEKRVQRPVELNLPPTANQNGADLTARKQSSNKSEAAASKSKNMLTRNLSSVQPVPSKQPKENGVCNGSLPSGKGSGSSFNSRIITSSSDSASHQMVKGVNYYPHGQGQGGQGLDDPVQSIKMATEKSQKQQNSSNHSRTDTSQAMPSARRDDANSAAAAAAARAWMSIGAGGFKQATEKSGTPNSQISTSTLYNPAREFHPQMSHLRAEFPFPAAMQFQVQSEKNNYPFQAFVPQQPVHMVHDAQLQNRPMVFPQLVGADLSRYHMPWRGLSSQTQPRQKQETLPPDLNIGFQSPDSPAKQSSSVIVDSQQPDLALQL